MSSAVTLPLKLKIPLERSPRSSGSKESFYRWVQCFREYASINEFIGILDGAVPLGMSTYNLSIGDALSQGLCDRDLEDGKKARWALLAAPSNRMSMRIVNTSGVISEAWAKLLVVFLPQSSSRTRALQQCMMNMSF